MNNLIFSIELFQYGDIQISERFRRKRRFWIIYIPIWLYSSEDRYIETCSFICIFTFQSGDIQIKIELLEKSIINNIYIPIWRYSNKGFSDIYLNNSKNLHSNLVIFKWWRIWSIIGTVSTFTFQYGDIQIKSKCWSSKIHG